MLHFAALAVCVIACGALAVCPLEEYDGGSFSGFADHIKKRIKREISRSSGRRCAAPILVAPRGRGKESVAKPLLLCVVLHG
jgi:hypothetical protein